MVKLVIFDMDGTLLNTLDDLADSCNHILQQYGYPTHPVDAYKYFVGNGIRKLIERTVPEEVLQKPELLHTIESDFLAYYTLHKVDKTAPYEGMVSVLNQLQSKNIQIAVASNKIDKEIAPLLDYFFPSIKFAAAIGQKLGVPTKPNPDVVYEILSQTQIKKDDTLYVGDTAVDMKTGKSAGIYTIGVLWGFRTEKELLDNGADELIHHPEDLLPLIDKLS